MSDSLRDFISQHVAMVQPLESAAARAYWDFTTTGQAEYQAELARLQVALRKIYADPTRFAALKALLAGAQEPDALLARQATLLCNTFTGNQMDDATIEELTRREVKIEAIFNSFRAELNGQKVTENEIKDILRQSTDQTLRRQAWEASKQIGAQVAPQLIELVELRNAIARRIGFDNFYRMSLTLQELDEGELFATFADLDRLGGPVYQRYKAQLDRQLADRFGLSPTDLRPWHYSDPFFQEAPLANRAIRELLSQTFAGQDIAQLTRRFYHAIGLDVDDVLDRSDLYERTGKQQHAYCIHIDRQGDIRVLGNIKPNEWWMSTMLHECGHAVYERYLDPNLPYLLRQPTHTLFTEAIAMLMGRLSTDADWLTVYAGVPAAEARVLAQQLGQQMSGQLLILSRWVSVMSHFERAFYENPRQDLNRLWWDIAERFQMVPRPEGRNAPDWAAKIHLSTAAVYYHNYLMGELLASQLRHCVEQDVLHGGAAGNVSRRFVTDRAVGEYLIQRVFRLGSSGHWHDTLARATGERLQPAYFVTQASAW